MKKWLSVLLAAGLCLTLLAGCGNDGAVDGSIDDTQEDVYYTVGVDAFYYEEDVRMFLMSEPWGDETVRSESNNISFMAVSGNTLSSLMADMDYSDFELLDPNGTFLGWMKYELHTELDEFDQELYAWVRADDVLYTTEEIMEIPVEGYSLSFVAKWSDIDDAYYTENGY